MVQLFDFFIQAHEARLQPTLLEFRHPNTGEQLDICGIEPTMTLEVRNGKLSIDGKIAGNALDIFTHLQSLEPQTTFFPAFLGYFSYEFAQYFGNPTKPASDFPDAYFRLYSRGVISQNGRVVEGETIERPTPSLAKPRQQLLSPLMSPTDFYEKCQDIKAKIRSGDVYQVNLSLPFEFSAHDYEMPGLYQAMRQANKSPFMGIFQHDDKWVISGSPERLFCRVGDQISVRPIAGTSTRHEKAPVENELIEKLLCCPKENAEHAMLVDLLRNDLNKIAQIGSTLVSEDRSVEFYSHVMHLVSEVQAKTQASLLDVFAAIFPGGTITGAPKVSVMKTIAELEIAPRGPYTGALGYVSGGWGCDFNILIRSVFKSGESVRINAGAGIVIDSDDAQEWNEVNRKAGSLNDILSNKDFAEQMPARSPIRGPALTPSNYSQSFLAKTRPRVFFLENHDSFSFNIVDSLRALNAQVFVGDSLPEINDHEDFTHLLIGPGPGSPTDMPKLALAIELALTHNWPLLGICLGHQAIGHYFGAQVARLPLPVHGKVHDIVHFGQGLFTGLASPIRFTRYHSLAIRSAPANFDVDAVSGDDCIMAIRHQCKPIFGLQFHPESYLSSHGQQILKTFLYGSKNG